MTVNGVEAVITVKDASEAAQLISALAVRPPEPVQPSQKTEAIQATVLSGILDAENDPAFPSVQVVDVIHGLAGSKAAMLLSVVLSFDGGCSDFRARQKLGELYGWSPDTNLGPIISNITKQCRREGIDPELILQRKSKRGMQGKMLYHFRVPEPTIAIIKGFPQFEKQPEFPGFDDVGDMDPLDI